MKKFLLIAVVCFSVFLFGDLNSTVNPFPFEQLIKNRTFEVYKTYTNAVSTYVHIAELPDWAQMNPEKDGYEGTSTLLLYEYINSLNPVPQPESVIVAVMDTGFDIDHPELKDKIWKNEKEINGQPGVDDDGNGYVDDFYGWNFLGKTTNLNLEVTRELQRLKKENVTNSDPYYRKVAEEFESRKEETSNTYEIAKDLLKNVTKAENKLKEKNYPTEPLKLMEVISTLSGEYKEAANSIIILYKTYGIDKQEIADMEKDYSIKMKCLFDTTSVNTLIGDNPNVLDEKNYGDNDVKTKGETHSTHVSGIIAADKKGIGQAPFAKIMCLRVVPDEGDERDKDVANGIKYAVDNGANIINLSAGKYFSPNSDYVTEAIRYAESKGVLFVVASGNEATDIAVKRNFPPKYYMEDGEMKYFSNMIVVGASTWMKNWNESKDPDNLADGYDLAASFSNYSSKVVDLFAPGVEINSTVTGGSYMRESGTSMAAPEVSGCAAIIKGYFPNADASELKTLLTGSVRKYEGVSVKLRDRGSKVLFSTLSKTGGVIDVYKAYLMAADRYKKN